MCDTCGCDGNENKYRITRHGEDGSHSHKHVHSHNHEFDHEHEHLHDGHTHSHSHLHNYSHSHIHDNDEHHHDHEHEHSHHDHDHDHDHHHHHTHEHDGAQKSKLIIEQNVLSKNNLLAERNRGYFEAKNIFALNIVSSPGSGKTSLLEKTIIALKDKVKISVIEGDQQTMNDADRINSAGAPVVQINTGNGCHLDSEMIYESLKKLMPENESILFIENVGNLVCPSLFDLGESKRVVVISTTEGDDKPLKYPNMFHSSDICVINKVDLLPYVDFSMEKVKENALKVNNKLRFFEVSVKTGEGIDLWLEWLKHRN